GEQFCVSVFFFFSSRRRHTRWPRDWSSDVCSSDLGTREAPGKLIERQQRHELPELHTDRCRERDGGQPAEQGTEGDPPLPGMFRRGQGERPRQRRERERRERAHPEEVVPAEECAERREVPVKIELPGEELLGAHLG